MKKFISIMLTLALLTSLMLSSFAADPTDGIPGVDYDPSAILIIIKGDADIDDVFGYMDFGKKNEAYISSTVRGIPMTVTVPTDEDYGKINEFYKISLTKEGEAKLDELIAELEKNPYIKAVSKNYYGELFDGELAKYIGSFEYFLTENTLILKNAASLNSLKELPIYFEIINLLKITDMNEWQSFKSALDSDKVKAVAKGTQLDADDRLPTGAVLSFEKDGNERQYTVILSGDVNCDGMANASDARLVLRHAAKLQEIDDLYAYTAANLNKFDRLDANDARTILRMAARLGFDYNWDLTAIMYYWEYPTVWVYADSDNADKLEKLADLEYVESVEVDEEFEDDDTVMYNVNLKAPYMDNLIRLRFDCREISSLQIKEKGSYGFLLDEVAA